MGQIYYFSENMKKIFLEKKGHPWGDLKNIFLIIYFES
jgi:hypothetical protein